MQYRFFHHTLDTKTSELINPSGVTLLKKKPFLLLQCLLKNPQQILSKDFLLQEVWDNRFVSDNTIAQTVGQLRQLIEVDSKNPKIILTHRGRGISFTPEVEIIDDDTVDDVIDSSNHLSSKTIGLTALLMTLVAVFIWWFYTPPPQQPQTQPVPNLLFLSTKHVDASETWLQNSVPKVFLALMNQKYAGKISVKQLTHKDNVNDFLNKKWNINSHLNVVTTDLVKNEFGYSLSLDLTRKNQISQSQRFSGDSVSDVLVVATKWLSEELNTDLPEFSDYLPNDSSIVELYMRGIDAEHKGDYEKAGQYYELALTELPEFHIARLRLAGIKKHLGEFDAALVLLDTLENTKTYPKINLKMVAIRGYIYNVQGRFDESKSLFIHTLEKYAQAPAHQLNPLRFELSYALHNLNLIDQALSQLNQIEQTTTLATDALILADAKEKIASIYQSMGQANEALRYADQSLDIYLKLGELLGAAKANNQLAIIYTLKNDYETAKYHLYEALSIARKMDYRLGIGATINELVTILIAEGDFDQAEQLTKEMEQIAIEIDYTDMLIAAKRHIANLAINRSEWLVAEQFLQQQEQLANSSNNQRALISGHLLQLEYWIAKGNTEGAQPIIVWLEQNIDKNQNIRQHIELELKRAKLKLIDGQLQPAIDLLIGIKGLAKSVGDNHALVQINNTLAELYLYDKTDKALMVIKENKNLNAVVYPFLLLHSKALKSNGRLQQSLALAIECRNKSGQHWTREDEAYLSQLRLLVD